MEVKKLEIRTIECLEEELTAGVLQKLLYGVHADAKIQTEFKLVDPTKDIHRVTFKVIDERTVELPE